jgi:hypothetical protein
MSNDMDQNQGKFQTQSTGYTATAQPTAMRTSRAKSSGGNGAMKAMVAFTAVALVLGVVAVVMFSSSSDKISGSDAPIVRADASPYKSTPDTPDGLMGGMEISNRDSTIYDSMRPSSANAKMAKIENLLEESGQPMDKLEQFARQVEAEYAEEQMNLASLEAQDAAIVKQLNATETAAGNPTRDIKNSPDMPQTQDIIISLGDDSQLQKLQQIASAQKAATKKPDEMHKAGQSPDTLEFVKSVLDDTPSQLASNATPSVADIEPAAGAGVSAPSYTKGSYFVQLASITDQSRATGEWKKLQKSHAQLSAVNYRVKRADLGAKGVYYRIQAGPFSKASANELCGTIKASKPGACLVTK